MENLRLLAFVAVLVACISVTSGGLVLKNFASPEITEQALASATQQLEASFDHSRARVRRATEDENGELCEDKVATCQKGVLALDSADRTCVDIYKAANCTGDSFIENDSCGRPGSRVSTAKFIVASYMGGFLSVSCNPKAATDEEDSLYRLPNKCVDKYYTKAMRTSSPSRIADVVCCGHVELMRCMTSSWTASRRTLFVESSYRRFVGVSRAPQFDFEGCDAFPIENCTK